MQTWFDPQRSGCRLIAEVGQNHDGSLGTAHAYIDAVAKTGVDAIKFQTHFAAAESTPDEPWRVRFSPQDETRYDYWKRMEFTPAQWHGLAEHAKDAGLIFLSSAFSMEAVELLDSLGVMAWKVGAGEITNLPMLRRMAKSGRAVLLSSGLADWPTLDAAVECVRAEGCAVGVFQCTTAYPCPPEKLGLNVIQEIRQRYGCPAGLSDHSGKIYAGLAAATLGAEMIEVHVTLSREAFGPDVPASLTTGELSQLVEGVRFIEKATGARIEKEAMAEELRELRRIFGKSVYTARSIEAGQTLEEADLAVRKPGGGIPADRLEQLLGKRVRRRLLPLTQLREEDVEELTA